MFLTHDCGIGGAKDPARAGALSSPPQDDGWSMLACICDAPLVPKIGFPTGSKGKAEVYAWPGVQPDPTQRRRSEKAKGESTQSKEQGWESKVQITACLLPALTKATDTVMPGTTSWSKNSRERESFSHLKPVLDAEGLTLMMLIPLPLSVLTLPSSGILCPRGLKGGRELTCAEILS